MSLQVQLMFGLALFTPFFIFAYFGTRRSWKGAFNLILGVFKGIFVFSFIVAFFSFLVVHAIK
ncbi:hypothetical protein [Bacillus paralicheniformis]|uniref:hypothetical protein n=1 Tax=Bacillus paralicheniformis TaxID=1648923 RepID=UPI001FD690A4|nr:hypothetical protein [Bacillus paralicheniformis]MCJ8223681.1 hypothetical protein [Bacillus paralicheniformis]